MLVKVDLLSFEKEEAETQVLVDSSREPVNDRPSKRLADGQRKNSVN
jgi:hypothetical protein